MMRIRRTRWKVLFVVAAIVVVVVGYRVLFARLLPHPFVDIAGSLLLAAPYLVGARVFRGRGEPVVPPRAWWRMTSRPTSGFVVASLLAVTVASDVVRAATSPADQLLASAVNAVVGAALTGLYLHSSVRLIRHPADTVPVHAPLPKWKPLSR